MSWMLQYNNVSDQLEEFRRERAGGVGGMGEDDVIPDRDPGVAVEFLEGVLFILREECGLVPLEKDMLAYSRTPISLCPASIATDRAVSPSLSVALIFISGC